LILSAINAYNLWNEHWQHWEHMPPLEDRPEYPYQNIRTKNYFWGDGDKTLLYVPPILYPRLRLWVDIRWMVILSADRVMNSWNENVNHHKQDE
jgi:hypothetical protein